MIKNDECNEIIKSGVNGIIIPVKDIQATYNAMRKLVMDQSYYDKLQGKSKEMIVNKYSQTELWNTLLKEYNSFLEFNINV